MSDGDFAATELSFRVDGGKFIVDCGDTDIVALCGQNTAKTFTLDVPDKSSLETLKSALQDALDELNTL